MNNNNVIKHYEFFLKHADHQELDHEMGDIIDQAEQEYERRMKKYEELEAKEFFGLEDDDAIDDVL